MNNTARILIAIGAGVAAGVAIGILIAPAKGSDTVDNINKQGKKIKKEFKEKLKEGKSLLNEYKEGIEKGIKEQVKTFA